jgi:hypothetical protein
MRSSDGSRRGIVSTQSARGGFRMESECVPALTMPFLQSEYAVMRCWHCSGSSCGERIHSAGVLPDLITLRRFSATRHDTGATRRGAQLRIIHWTRDIQQNQIGLCSARNARG